MTLCIDVKANINFLPSIIPSQCDCSTEGYNMKEFTDGVELWIFESVEVIKKATGTFRNEGNLQLPQPFTWAGSVSLLPFIMDLAWLLFN